MSWSVEKDSGCDLQSCFLHNQTQKYIFSLTAFWFVFNFYCYSITVVCLFSPSLHPTPAEHTTLPHLHHPPWFCPCVLYSSSCNPLSSLSPPPSPLNEWIQKLWYIYTMEFYTAGRKKELIPFAAAWMELESIMLSEISQTVRDKYHMISPLTGT